MATLLATVVVVDLTRVFLASNSRPLATGRELAVSFFGGEVTSFERLFRLVEDRVFVNDNEQGTGRIFDY